MYIDQLHPLLLNIGLAVHEADWNWKNVNSPFMRIYYVTEGSAQIEMPTYGIVRLKAGHMYFIPAFTTHSYVCNAHFVHYYLHIYEENEGGFHIQDEWNFPVEIKANALELNLIIRLHELNPCINLVNSNPAIYDNYSQLIENVKQNKQRPLYKKIESRGILYCLIAAFLKHANKKEQSIDERITNAKNYIHKHIYEDIDISTLSGDACVSKDHFIRLFKKELGITPMRYINQKKIEKAQLMLITDDTPIKNIACSLSFYDYSYFNRIFKKMTGMTPLQYRNSNH